MSIFRCHVSFCTWAGYHLQGWHLLLWFPVSAADASRVSWANSWVHPRGLHTQCNPFQEIVGLYPWFINFINPPLFPQTDPLIRPTISWNWWYWEGNLRFSWIYNLRKSLVPMGWFGGENENIYPERTQIFLVGEFLLMDFCFWVFLVQGWVVSKMFWVLEKMNPFGWILHV